MQTDLSTAEIIFRYFPNLSEKQKQQFNQLHTLYTLWNNQINVVSRKDLESLYEKHVLHSLSIAEIISFKPNTKILDIGTGGGFPGIPLAILFPQCQFTLVDSIGKKIKVVAEVSTALGLQNVKAINTRVENVVDTFDFITSRAVAPFSELVKWTKGKIALKGNNDLPNGYLFLKGGDLGEELKLYQRVQQFDLKDFYKEEFFETKKIIYYPVK